MRRLALALFASVFVLAAFVPSGARAATGAALPAQTSDVAEVTAPGSTGCATEELKCRLSNLVCAVVNCNPASTTARTTAPGMTCSFPDDPTGGDVCKVVLIVVGVVCRNHCLVAGDSPATPTTTRAVHFSRLYTIN